MRGGERIDEELLKRTHLEKPALGEATDVAAVCPAPEAAGDQSPPSLVENTKTEHLPEAVEADVQAVDGTAKNSVQPIGAVLLQKLPLEALDPHKSMDKQVQQQPDSSEPPKQSRQSSADTCDTELLADGNNNSCSLQAVHEELCSSRSSRSSRSSSSSSSVRTSSAGSDSSNCSDRSNDKGKSSFSFFHQKAKSRGSESNCSTDEHQQQLLQPGDTPRFGPAAAARTSTSSSYCNLETHLDSVQQHT
ncbi:LOW QUALITY PROTEIN: uncharacterized protein EMH_0074420 [Eimeria mitis]|uniref:Uncharacterized protein n=1 Tax=Eimeria mitis TaxID=44415 RepID=U6KHK9_9EIME|nr:LOW QUALITY PROTEIN: uncharacterized protein EMH_0074420 [Eimeria mitis]CDJ36276.1 hypothetical protein EMH_0074420 [Eimeria mitis]